MKPRRQTAHTAPERDSGAWGLPCAPKRTALCLRLSASTATSPRSSRGAADCLTPGAGVPWLQASAAGAGQTASQDRLLRVVLPALASTAPRGNQRLGRRRCWNNHHQSRCHSAAAAPRACTASRTRSQRLEKACGRRPSPCHPRAARRARRPRAPAPPRRRRTPRRPAASSSSSRSCRRMPERGCCSHSARRPRR